MQKYIFAKLYHKLKYTTDCARRKFLLYSSDDFFIVAKSDSTVCWRELYEKVTKRI